MSRTFVFHGITCCAIVPAYPASHSCTAHFHGSNGMYKEPNPWLRSGTGVQVSDTTKLSSEQIAGLQKLIKNKR